MGGGSCHPPGGVEVVEAPKVPKKNIWPKVIGAKGAREDFFFPIFDF